jgi:predicted secreted hydrolase
LVVLGVGNVFSMHRSTTTWTTGLSSVSLRVHRWLKRVCGLGLAIVLAGTLTAQDGARGFAVPQPGRVFEFPRDHGSHPEYRVEWWYLTGHLFTTDRQRFGFQATFFRQAAPDGVSQLHLAHMGVVETATGRFLHQERLDRAGWDAGAATDRLDLHHGPWSLRMIDDEREIMRLHGGVMAETRFELELVPAKPLVLFGENGLSRKGADPTAVSYYLTFTRLQVKGTLEWSGRQFPVTGEAWMDHEISSNQLSAEQVGWDWVSIQLADGREVMLYRLRLQDGQADPASTLTWIDQNGELQRADFDWIVQSTWTSPKTGATYPARVQIATTDPASGKDVVFQVEPLVADQELPGTLSGIPYWEGACRVRDGENREIGSAYMELTGYAKPLAF